MSKKLIAVAVIVITSSVFLNPAHLKAQDNEQYFTDVPSSSAYFTPLQYLKSQNLVSGFPDGSFRPDDPVNRAEALAMILKTSGVALETEDEDQSNPVPDRFFNSENPIQIELPENTPLVFKDLTTGERTEISSAENIILNVSAGTGTVRFARRRVRRPFNDVSKNDWFYDAVATAKKNGITAGYEEGKYFRPDREINLVEAIRMLYKSSNTEVPAIGTSSEITIPPNIDSNAWFAADILHGISTTLLTQSSDGSIFPPERPLKRGELATLLYRFGQIPQNASFGYASWYGDGLARTNVQNASSYLDRSLTAAHRSLPFGTILRVTNMQNGQYVDVVVNDRGPYITGRIIDLSRTAFSSIAEIGTGVIPVQVRTVNF